jgi:hypothetical protein
MTSSMLLAYLLVACIAFIAIAGFAYDRGRTSTRSDAPSAGPLLGSLGFVVIVVLLLLARQGGGVT